MKSQPGSSSSPARSTPRCRNTSWSGLRSSSTSARGAGLRGAKILIVGAAYKKNVEDMRESPAFKLMEIIERRGATTAYYDPFVPSLPKMREHPQFHGRKSVAFSRDVLAGFDAAVIATDHDGVDYKALCAAARLVIDTRNACARAGIVSDTVVKA